MEEILKGFGFTLCYIHPKLLWMLPVSEDASLQASVVESTTKPQTFFADLKLVYSSGFKVDLGLCYPGDVSKAIAHYTRYCNTPLEAKLQNWVEYQRAKFEQRDYVHSAGIVPFHTRK